MTALVVRIIAGPREWTLGDEPLIVPAGPVVVGIKGSRSRTVLLDGRPTRLSSGTEGLFSIDLTRSTGFHRLQIGESAFWFGTEDAKLGLAGIEAMLAHLKNLGTGWTGQALFSDGSGLRDVHVLYAWMDQWADKSLIAIEAILDSPRSVTQNSKSLSRRGGAGVLLNPTLKLLRSAPRQYLTASPSGVISVGGTKYDPLRVVVRKRRTTLDTVANRRAVGLLNQLAKMSQEVLENRPDRLTTVRCRLWLNKAQALQRRPLAQALAKSAALSTLPRQAEEATESAYRTSYETLLDMRSLFGWTASLVPMSRLSYVERADTIYQAYAASCLAKALGLTQTNDVLGSQPLAFTGPRYDLYYDTPPPPSVLRSWRADSKLPDVSRPDLLLHERETGRVALLDAKYRVGRDGGATEDSRKEVTSYLGLYGLRSITILFPGSQNGQKIVSGHGRTIVEKSVVPPADFSAALPDILETLENPPF